MLISIASGKGGTGKTLVATSLALSLKDTYKVQLLDCDVEEPNDHIFLKPIIENVDRVFVLIPEVDNSKCTYCGKCAEVCAFNAIAVIKDRVLVFPELCHGCGACSYLCPEKAITEREKEVGIVEIGKADSISFAHGKLNVGEAMAPPIIRKVKEYIDPAAITIIDVSPGTSCPVVESIRDSDFCLLVTEPTPFGLNDLILAIEVVRKLEIPCGVVINRAGVGDSQVADYCLKEGLPVLRAIPLDTEIAKLYSKGIPLVEGIPEWKESFTQLFQKIEAITNERISSTKR